MLTIHEQEIQNKMKKYYRVKEVAELFSLSEKTIKRWISDKFIKAVRIGNSVRIPIAEMERVIQPTNE